MKTPPLTPADLYESLGGLDTELLERSESARRTRPIVWIGRVAIAAACIGLIVAVAIHRNRPPQPLAVTPPSSDATTTTPSTSRNTTHTTTGESYTIPKWEEQTVSEQFGEVTVGDRHYDSQNTKLPADRLGEARGRATLSGYDIYTDTAHQITADLFTIRGIAEECAVAVRFDGSSDAYVYVNTWYTPQTLGQFIDDLALRDHLTFGTIEDRDGNSYTGADSAYIWSLLLAHTDAKSVADFDDLAHYERLIISVSHPLLGERNKGLSITDDGWLDTNLLHTGKSFYIGKEAAVAFRAYVEQHTTHHAAPPIAPDDAPGDSTTVTQPPYIPENLATGITTYMPE